MQGFFLILTFDHNCFILNYSAGQVTYTFPTTRKRLHRDLYGRKLPIYLVVRPTSIDG